MMAILLKIKFICSIVKRLITEYFAVTIIYPGSKVQSVETKLFPEPHRAT
jgi:hypothetical protein